MFIPDHDQGYLDWGGYLADQQRIGGNMRPVAHLSGAGSVWEGCALLPGAGRLRGPRA